MPYCAECNKWCDVVLNLLVKTKALNAMLDKNAAEDKNALIDQYCALVQEFKELNQKLAE